MVKQKVQFMAFCFVSLPLVLWLSSRTRNILALSQGIRTWHSWGISNASDHHPLRGNTVQTVGLRNSSLLPAVQTDIDFVFLQWTDERTHLTPCSPSLATPSCADQAASFIHLWHSTDLFVRQFRLRSYSLSVSLPPFEWFGNLTENCQLREVQKALQLSEETTDMAKKE